MAALFHPVTAPQMLACDDCGCVIDPSERGRSAHERFHDRQEVIDLRVEEMRHA